MKAALLGRSNSSGRSELQPWTAHFLLNVLNATCPIEALLASGMLVVATSANLREQWGKGARRVIALLVRLPGLLKIGE